MRYAGLVMRGLLTRGLLRRGLPISLVALVLALSSGTLQAKAQSRGKAAMAAGTTLRTDTLEGGGAAQLRSGAVLAQGTPLVEDTPEKIKGHPKVREAYLGESA